MSFPAESLAVSIEVDEISKQKPKALGKKRFQCRFCRRLFARHEHLQRHERLHTKEKPFQCLKCPRAFNRSDLLSRHDGLSHRETSVNGSAPNKRAVGQPPYLPDASQGDQPFEGTNTSIRTSSLDSADPDEGYLQDRPRQLTRFKPESNGTLPSSEITALEQALKNWQCGWESNPESSLDPQDPHGPLAFNSTALLRMAYIRLSFDIGPGRALDTQDAVQIARAIRQSPPIQRSRKVTRAVLHAAHALSIPIKLGVSLVARNQLFMRSIQHSLCSLECAFLLSKWLDAVTIQPLDPPLSEDERKLLAFVTSLLNETEFAGPAATATRGFEEASKKLSASVVRVWAKLFKSDSGQSIWDIVDVIGRALDVYADMLDAGSQGDM